jgi:NAD(P)-dependent dehydrogenase (short-subunit alcohol dehydrogenase family)
MKLKNKIAIITGGGRGIGRGMAIRFAAEGASVVLAQRDRSSADVTATEIRSNGGEALVVPTDVSQASQVDALTRKTLDRYGRIDILVNNAGIAGGNGRFLELPFETWEHVIAVNLTGIFLCGQAVARGMVAQGIHGRIINIGSINSFAAEKETAAYAASKGGILLLTKAMAVDLAEYGIAVNCLCIGPVLVERNASLFNSEPLHTVLAKSIPVGRPGDPEEVAAAAVFFASDECTFVTGASLLIDGGYLAYNQFD